MHCEWIDPLDFSNGLKLHNRKGRRVKAARKFALHIPLSCLFGFSFYLGWIFCLFWSPAFLVAGTLDDFGVHLVRMLMTVAMFLSYVSFGLFSRFLSSPQGEMVLRVLSLILCPCACVAGFPSWGIGQSAAIVFWVASGMGSAALLLVWSKKLVGLNRKQIVFISSGSFFVAAFLFSATAFMPESIVFLAMAMIPIVSVFIACVVASPSFKLSYEGCGGGVAAMGKRAAADSLFAEDSLSETAAPESQRATFMRTIMLAFAYSTSIGFVGSCATSQIYYPSFVYAIAMGNAAAALFCVVFLVKRPHDISTVLMEAFLPIMLVCIFIFSFADYAGRLVCIGVMLALLACHDISDTVNVSKSSGLFGENHVKTFAVGRTLNGLGCSLGWAVGMVLVFLPGIDAAGRMFVCFALVVFLVLITSFAIFHPEPLFYACEVYESSSNGADGESSSLDIGFKAKAVADRFGLTSRQTEVLLCLAQGRNAGYIAQKFTISAHTAKSHIYNIYNKLGVHSQQELLDIIDEVEGSPNIKNAGHQPSYHA